MKLTILHIFSGDLWAGAEVMIFNLLKRLKSDNNLEIVAVSLNEGQLAANLRDAGIDIHVLPESENSFMQIYRKALHICRKYRIDVIHSHRFKENVLAILLSKSLNIKRLFTTIHGLPEHQFKNRTKRNRSLLKARVNFFLLRFFFTRIVAVSNEMKTVLNSEYHVPLESVAVIHNGIPIPQPALNNDNLVHSAGAEEDVHDIHIGSVGRLVPVKNYELLLHIVADTRLRSRRVRFSILGDGPLKAHLHREASRLNILDGLDFYSFRPDPFPYYRSLDIYINTSTHEGMPLSILEAMACGIPVIAPKVGGIAEVIDNGENGILVSDGAVATFVESCFLLIENDRLRRDMVAKARSRIISQFSDESMAQKYATLYRQISI